MEAHVFERVARVFKRAARVFKRAARWLANPKSYRLRLISCFIVASLLPVILIMQTSRMLFTYYMRTQLEEAFSLTQRIIETGIEKRVMQLDQIMNVIIRDSSLIRQISYGQAQESYEKVTEYKAIIGFFGKIKEYFDIYSIRIYVNESNRLGADFYLLSDLDAMPGVRERIDRGETSFWKTSYPFRANTLPYAKGERHIFSRVQYIKNFQEKDSYSVCFVDILEDELYAMLNEAAQGSGDAPASTVLLDALGNVVSCADKSMLSKHCGFEYADRLLSGGAGSFVSGGDLVVYRTAPFSGLILVSNVPLDVIKAQTTRLSQIIFIFGALSVMAAILLSLWLSGRMSWKINLLLAAMQPDGGANAIPKPVAQDKYKSKYKHNGRDDLDRLIHTYNSMAGQIKVLVEEVYETKLHESELRFGLLQAQIAPHFLYNMFESLKSLIVSKRNEEAERLTFLLSRFYRTALSSGRDKITIAEELEMISNYFQLQQLCYGDDITLEIDADRAILDCYIVKFTLQPIVENAIVHGIRESGLRGLIRVAAKQHEGGIRITVADNGAGIAEGKLAKLRAELQGNAQNASGGFGGSGSMEASHSSDASTASPISAASAASDTLAASGGFGGSGGSDGYGIYNVNKRLRIYYADNCSMRIESVESTGINAEGTVISAEGTVTNAEGSGTTVEIRIPFESTAVNLSV